MNEFEEIVQEIDFDFKRNVVIRRFFEFFISNFALSVIAVALNVTGLITQRYALVILLALLIAVFEYVNIKKMRLCYADIKDLKMHYLLNYIAYAVFIALNAAVYKCLPSVLHTILFSLTKILTYIDVPYRWSFALFHVVSIIVIALAPVGETAKMIQEEVRY